MKNFISYLLVFLLLFSILPLTGCTDNQSSNIETSQDLSNSFNWTINNSIVDFSSSYTDEERNTLLSGSLDTYIVSSPLYYDPAFQLPWTDKEYFKLRQDLIDNIILETDQVLSSIDILLDLLNDIDSKIFSSYENISKLDNIDSYINVLENDYSNLIYTELVLREKIDIYKNFSEDYFDKSMDQYFYILSVYELQSVILNHLGRISSDIEFIVGQYNNSTDISIRESVDDILTTLDSYTKYDKNVSSLVSYGDYIAKSINALEESDKYFSVASITITESISEEILINKTSIENTENIDKDTKDLILTTAEFYKEFSAILKEELLNSIDIELLNETSNSDTIISNLFLIAEATENDKTSTASKYIDVSKKTLSVSKTKVDEKVSFFGLLKKIAVNAPSITTKALGDLASRIQHKTQSFVEEKYLQSYGVDKKQIDSIMKKSNDDFEQRRKEGKQYGDAYNQIYSKFEDIENIPGDLSEKILGKNTLSKTIRGAGKFLTGTVTGLGKGVVKIMNPESKNSDYIDGGIDVTLSIIPGLDIFGKLSGAIIKKSNTAIKFLGQKTYGLSKTLISKISKNKEVITNTFSKIGKFTGVKKLSNYLVNTGKKAGAIFSKAKNKFTSIFTNSKPSKIISSIKNKVSSTLQNENSLVRSILGNSGEETVGNYLASLMWNEVKGQAKLLDTKNSSESTSIKSSNNNSTSRELTTDTKDIISEESEKSISISPSTENTEKSITNDADVETPTKENIKDGENSVESKIPENYIFYGTYSGYLTSANVGGMDISVNKNNTSSTITILEDKSATMKVSISGTGVLDMNSTFDGTITSIKDNKISITFIDDEGDQEILNANINQMTLSGSITLVVDGENIGTLIFTSNKTSNIE